MIVACVRTGDKYPVSYVQRLKLMVERNLKRPHRFVCFSDEPIAIRKEGLHAVDISELHLKSWWGKMAIFAREWRADQRVLYFDLDTVIAGDLTPLSSLEIDFGICANFTRAAGNLDWPCLYGSCVMSLGPSFDGEMFKSFWADRHAIMDRAGKYGDQKAIEELLPNATLLQPLLHPNFFLGYRDLLNHKASPPDGCSVVIFAGNSKPHNCEIKWVKSAWTRLQ